MWLVHLHEVFEVMKLPEIQKCPELAETRSFSEKASTYQGCAATIADSARRAETCCRLISFPQPMACSSR